MKTIYQLTPDIIANIAAGEVVENPASVVKELIENSLDASATHIDIELTEGGLEKIVIRDNGTGMSIEDMLLCFLPHTTSKIRSTDDLYSLSSFGFRGEAIWSIASVSSMIIKSRESNQQKGNQISLLYGKLVEQQPVGMPEGTEITIENIFSNTPARKKFLKDTATEVRNVVDVVLQCALAFPKHSFKLSHNGKILVHVSAQETHHDRLRAILGEYMALHSVPITAQSTYGEVTGFIGRPQIAGRSRTHQYVYINNRPVNPSILSKSVFDAYSNLIEPRSYPQFSIFLTVPTNQLDVNIHPKKEEVAFAYTDEIKKLISEAVSQALSAYDLTYRDPKKDTANGIDFFREQGMDYTTASMIRKAVLPWNVKEIPDQDILQVNNLYLIVPTNTGILLVDQHAAHERILYEQFLETYKAERENKEIHELVEPLVIDLPVSDSLILAKELAVFQKLGFDIEEFGERTFKLSAVPLFFKERDYTETLYGILNNIKENPSSKQEDVFIDRQTDRTLSFIACRTAIKGGEALSSIERKRLIEKLLETKTSYTCPHGRPTHIEISLNELDKMFKRK